MHSVVSITISPRRLLKKGEAAAYCRRTVRQFENECPVAPVQMPGGDLLYDVQDLDDWIDSLKSRVEGDEDIVSRLA
jgi:hypothetical protein